MKMLKKLWIVLFLLPAIASGESVYDENATVLLSNDFGFGLSIDSLVISEIAVAGDFLWDIGDSICWSPIYPSKSDTIDHYVDRIDSSWVLDRIECDTTAVGVYKKDDTTWAESIKIECDSVYVRKLTRQWKPLVTVKLTPTQFERLLALLDRD